MTKPETKFSQAEIAVELNRIARADEYSLPTRIEPSKLNEIIALVEQDIVPGFDIEVSVIAALGRVRETYKEWFLPSRKKRRRQWQNNHDLFASTISKKETNR